MSDKCSSCDCSDKTSCVKKGYVADIIETEKSYNMEETTMMNVAATAEHDGCKCGSSCACTNCTCGH